MERKLTDTELGLLRLVKIHPPNKNSWGEGWQKAQISWASIGSVDAFFAHAFSERIGEASNIATTMDQDTREIASEFELRKRWDKIVKMFYQKI